MTNIYPKCHHFENIQKTDFFIARITLFWVMGEGKSSKVLKNTDPVELIIDCFLIEIVTYNNKLRAIQM